MLFKSSSSEPFAIFDFCVSACVVLSAVAFLRSGVHYAFGSDCLEVRLFGIPFRKISWDRIDTASYLRTWKDVVLKSSGAMGGAAAAIGSTSGQIIYVTIKGCPQYHPKEEIRLFHNLLHPFRTACIWLPYGAKEQYIEAFRAFYPKLKIQPL